MNLLQKLEAERDMPGPAPFDWEAEWLRRLQKEPPFDRGMFTSLERPKS